MANYEFKKDRLTGRKTISEDLRDYYYTDPSPFRKGEAKTLKNLGKNIRFKYVKPLSEDSRFEIDADRDKLMGTFRYRWK